MNLYLFNDTDSAAVYGIGTYIRELTCALEDTAINVHIVYLHSVRLKFEIVKTNQTENWYIPEVCYDNPSNNAIQEIEDYYKNAIYLFRLHIKDTKNLIFQFNFNSCYLLAKGLKAVFDCKTIAVIHYTKWQLQLYGNLIRLRLIKSKPQNQRNSFEQMMYISYEYENIFFREIDRGIALSQHMKNILIDEYQLNPNKISIILNGLHDIYKNDHPKLLRRKWLLTNQVKIILFVGRLDDCKGIGHLIMAFRKVLQHHPKSKLLIVGDGVYSTYMKISQDICTKVTYCGLLDKERLFELYRISDIGVLPSFTEQCSYVAIEMMMHSLPMVSTAAPGLAEMTEDGISSLQVPIIEYSDRVEIDTNLLAEKMLFLLEHPAEAKRLGKNARKRYEERYSGDIFRKNMLNFYRSLHE